jgi:hypothetical protein
MLVVHGPFPFLQLCLLVPAATVDRGLLLASSEWRWGVAPESGTCPT